MDAGIENNLQLRTRTLSELEERQAAYHLAHTHPDFSAHITITSKQVFLAGVLVGSCGWITWYYEEIWIWFIWWLFVVICVVSLLKIIFILTDSLYPFLKQHRFKRANPKDLSPDRTEWPVYTVLIPLYKEEETVLQRLADGLSELDYPPDKLDIKLLLEADDEQTQLILPNAFCDISANVDVLLLPPGVPRTKPKALNAALPYIHGEYIVIYDAEDKPDCDQIKKAVLNFENAPHNVVALQARLTFMNRHENLLTRLFSIDYDVWFLHFMPGLAFFGLPVPLGGTSMHIRTRAIRLAGGWDAFNVTEDCDLGIRLSRFGWKTQILHSQTLEEANCEVWNWMTQRTRWLKGYMQCWLVHMRHPWRLIRESGFIYGLSIQTILLGMILSTLLAPIVWTIFFLWLTDTIPVPQIFDGHMTTILSFMLWSGIGQPLWAFALTNRYQKGNDWKMYFLAFIQTFYWFLCSIAGWRALIQLFQKPFLWEKTRHGISKYLTKTQSARVKN